MKLLFFTIYSVIYAFCSSVQDTGVGTSTSLSPALPTSEGVWSTSALFTYKAPDGAPIADDYDVYVQPYGGSEWIKIDTYMAQVNAPIAEEPDLYSAMPEKGRGVYTGHARSRVSYAYFDFTGEVSVKVVTKHKKFASARVRPDHKSVACNVQNDSTIQFMLSLPENLSVEFDGNIRDNLHIFTSKPQLSLAEIKKQARKQGRRFVCIPYGFYDVSSIPSLNAMIAKQTKGESFPDTLIMSDLIQLNPDNDAIIVPSNTTIYVEPGTYIKGTFLFESVRNSSVIGRSIARPDRGYGGGLVWRSKDICVDGLITNQLPTGGSDNVYIHDCRSISYSSWGDGMNVFASSNVTFDRVFVRSSDDCTTAYATRGGFSGNCTDITMKNSTLWADVAHPIFIGIHGNAERGDTIENLRYENIDILGQNELQLDYQGCLAINCGDNNLVRNVTFDNIRIENIDHGCPIQLKVGYNSKYCTAPGRGIENVMFRNICYNGTNMQQSMILGYDGERTVKNITFEGFKVNGKLIYDDMPTKPKWYKTADEANIYINDHVKNIVFKK